MNKYLANIRKTSNVDTSLKPVSSPPPCPASPSSISTLDEAGAFSAKENKQLIIDANNNDSNSINDIVGDNNDNDNNNSSSSSNSNSNNHKELGERHTVTLIYTDHLAIALEQMGRTDEARGGSRTLKAFGAAKT